MLDKSKAVYLGVSIHVDASEPYRILRKIEKDFEDFYKALDNLPVSIQFETELVLSRYPKGD